MLSTMAARHMVAVESFLGPSRLMHGKTSSADTSTQLFFYHVTHITLLSPFHVATDNTANSNYSNFPSVSFHIFQFTVLQLILQFYLPHL
jgi:hypothetical protein